MDSLSFEFRDDEDSDLWDFLFKDGLVFPTAGSTDDDSALWPAALPLAPPTDPQNTVAFAPLGSDSQTAVEITGLFPNDQVTALADDLNETTGFRNQQFSPFTRLTTNVNVPAPQAFPGLLDLHWPSPSPSPFPQDIPSFPEFSLDDFINVHFPFSPMRSDLNQPQGSDQRHPPWASPTFTAPLVSQHDEIQVTLNLDSGLPDDSLSAHSSVVPRTSSVCDSSARCLQCLLSSIPAHLCVRVRFADEPVFKKWNVGIYQSKMRWGDLPWVPGEIDMNLYHYERGPILPVKRRQFVPNQLDQIHLWGKTPTGWRCEVTAALGLSATPSDEAISRYITEYIPYCAVEASKDNPQLQAIIQTASQSTTLLPLALQLWTATRLLMKGWQAPENPFLGITRVDNPGSPYHQTLPAPRVLQNQIDSRIEALVARVELQLLKELQRAMKQNTCAWTEIFSTVYLILRVYKWKHPESPSQLVQRSLFCSNLLLAHLHCAGGIPDDFRSSSKPALSRVANAKALHQEMDDDSLDDTLSSLAFADEWRNDLLVKPAAFGCY
ncbi:hypothetical protein DHEL01_v200514 [Diaporthe helianthi]|uniref:Uncharacterized protein n=1 Tax=Diaporthe helianthi TaxID=158607 RepID=A0A2P5IF31_DIAHE|nr:hypothetical protein DHEL01_v200514 [Diaporthe helianthi]